jgi:hypothetical protein
MSHGPTVWSDNTPAASWSTKMADKASTPIAGQLLRALASHAATYEPLGSPHRDPLCWVTKPPGRHGFPLFPALPSWQRQGAPLRIGRRVSNSIQSNLFSLCFFTDELVSTHPPGVRAEFARGLDSSWQKVAHATVDGAVRTTHWRNWGMWCSRFGFDKFLTNVPQR